MQNVTLTGTGASTTATFTVEIEMFDCRHRLTLESVLGIITENDITGVPQTDCTIRLITSWCTTRQKHFTIRRQSKFDSTCRLMELAVWSRDESSWWMMLFGNTAVHCSRGMSTSDVIYDLSASDDRRQTKQHSVIWWLQSADNAVSSQLHLASI